MKNGFTLIELSIVLVIIGLLIGGILIGQSLIFSAKINSLYSTIVQMEVLTNQFKQRFRQLPGDFNRATTMLGATANGNNDGIIDYNEYRDAFQQMALAGFMDKRYLTIDVGNSGFTFNSPNDAKNTMMPTSFENVGVNYAYTQWTGFMDINSLDGTPAQRRLGNYFHIGKVISGDTDARSHYGHYFGYGASNNADFLSIIEAKSFDKKFDDGNARSGKIYAYGSSNNCSANYSQYAGANNGWISSTAATPICGLIYWYHIY